MEKDVLIVLGSLATALLAIIAVFAYVFVTKDKFNTEKEKINNDCSDCRRAIYLRLEEMKKDISNKVDYTSFNTLVTQIANMDKNLAILLTKFEAHEKEKTS